MAAARRRSRGGRRKKLRKVILVATEGSVTEKVYFEEFRGPNFRKNVHVKILTTSRRGDSSPKAVLRRLKKEVRKREIRKEDEVWMVIDRDNWSKDAIKEVAEECGRLGYSLALSNPCFELWLVLHQEDRRTPRTCKDCCSELEKLLDGYDKTSYPVKDLLAHLDRALERGRQIDKTPTQVLPNAPCTRVYKLVEILKIS